MPKFWINDINGTVGFNDDKTVYYADNEYTVNILQTAIWERQIACGFGDSPWDEEDPVNPSNMISKTRSYTIDEYIDYVNAIAPSFLNGAYTGGESEPTMFGATYADSANNVFELFTLVKGLLKTQLDCTLQHGYYRVGTGTPSALKEASASNAGSDYNQSSKIGGSPDLCGAFFAGFNAIYPGGPLYLCYKYVYEGAVVIPSITGSTQVAKTGYSVWMKAASPDSDLFTLGSFVDPVYTFDKQGFTDDPASAHYCPDEDSWGKVAEYTSTTLPGAVALILDSDIIGGPPNFALNWYSAGSWNGAVNGFQLIDPFVIINWSFQHV